MKTLKRMLQRGSQEEGETSKRVLQRKSQEEGETSGMTELTAEIREKLLPDLCRIVYNYARKYQETFEGKDHRWVAEYHDKVIPFWKMPHPLEAQLASCTFQVSFKDQGYGNRKGHLILKLVREGKELQSADVSGTAGHEWEVRTNVIAQDHALIKESRPGDQLVLCRFVLVAVETGQSLLCVIRLLSWAVTKGVVG